MNKKDLSMMFLSVIFIITLITSIVFYLITKQYTNIETTAPITTVETVKQGFKLSEYEGKIAVFELGSKEPVEVFDVYLTSLPQNEQNKIKSGLYAENESELQTLIEDYTS